MKSKNITTAESHHASELSDDALLDVFGGSTEYVAQTEAAHGSQVTINIFIDADGSNGVSVGGKPVTSETRGSSNTTEHGATTHTSTGTTSSGSTTSTSSSTTHANGSTTSGSGGADPHATTTSSGSGGATTSSSGTRGTTSTSGSDPHVTTSTSTSTSKSQDKHEQGDHHHGIREAFEAAHDRFHQELDHVSDGFDEIAHGVGAIATAAVELNPIVAGVHFLNDAHKKTSSSATKKP